MLHSFNARVTVSPVNANQTNETESERAKFWEFLLGMAQTLDTTVGGARWEWAAFSRQLSDTERRKIEQGGNDAGIDMANDIRRIDQ